MLEVKMPFNGRDWFDVWNWIEESGQWDKVADDRVPLDLEGFCAFQRELADSNARVSWGVWRDGILGGVISLDPDVDRPWIVHCHCVFRKAFWGYDTTIPALRAVAKEIYEAGIERIEMRVFSNNRAIRALVQKLGGVEEGVLRAQTKRGGENIDVVVYGMTRQEFNDADWRSDRIGKPGRRGSARTPEPTANHTDKSEPTVLHRHTVGATGAAGEALEANAQGQGNAA